MTRETKIGLLVGLGFIVVFAVLLSNSGSAPSGVNAYPRVANVPPAETGGASATTLTNTVGAPTGNTPTELARTNETPESPSPMQANNSGTPGSDLPAPKFFDNSDLILANNVHPAEPGADARMREEIAAALPSDTVTLEAQGRTAPLVVEAPAPTVRSGGPSVTDPPLGPSGTEAVVSTEGHTNEGGERVAHAELVAAQQYTIEKGDTLVGITRKMYSNSSPQVIDLVLAANKSTIKDRNSIMPGKTITIPALPADKFAATSGSASGKGMSEIASRINKINVPGNRQAPNSVKPDSTADTANQKDSKSNSALAKAGNKPEKSTVPVGQLEFVPITTTGGTGNSGIGSPPAAPKIEASESKRPVKPDAKADKADKSDRNDKSDKSARPAPAKKGDRGGRWYEVQPRDTYSSIAERELGSRHRWAEIRQLNKDVDPVKLKPGLRIRLPNLNKESLSADASKRRVSA